MSVFRMYDVRGIAGKELTPELFVEIGLSVGTFLKGKGTIAVGRDSRTSGSILMNSLIAGILSTGCDARNLGIVSTPTVYYATAHIKEVDAGIMITASHNPPEYNGFKFCLKQPGYHIQPVAPKEIKEIFDKKQYLRVDYKKMGHEKQLDAITDYEKYLGTRFSFKRKLKVAVDVGNGACGFAVDVLKSSGHDVTVLYPEPNGLFPNHVPNPIQEKNMLDLEKAVNREKADVGIAFDGDGDRVGFVDEKGKMISSAEATMLFAGAVLGKGKSQEIVVDVTASRAIGDYVTKAGGNLKMVRVGYPFIQAEIRRSGAPFAAEYSGHYYFASNGGYDDGLYAALSLLSILDSSSQPVSSLIEQLPKYVSSPEQRFECSDATKFQLIDKVKAAFKQKGYRVNETDGARVEFEHGWMLIRASNTEPAVVMRFEADSSENLAALRDVVLPVVKQYMENVTL